MIAQPSATSTPYFDKDGVLQHREDERGALQGSIFIVAEETEQPYRSDQRNEIENIRHSIEKMNALRAAGDVTLGLAKITSDIRAMADFVINFSLFRTGECRLRKSGDNGETPEQDALLVRHAYFFIRDCAHRHYHHADKDDRLLPAVAVNPDSETDESEWRREVLWALTRTIGEYRRSRSLAQRRQALGITAYADAFQATLARIRRRQGAPSHTEDHSIATFDFGHLKESAKVANEVSAWRRQGRFSVAALAIATIISVSALWVAISRLAEQRDWNHDGAFASMVQWYYAHPGYVLSMAVGLIILAWDITYSERPITDRFFKTLLAASWPGKSYGKRAKTRLYSVAIVIGMLLLILLDFQFGIWIFP